MTEAAFLDRLDAWALGAVDDRERAALERYAAEHPEVGPAVRRAFTAAAALGAALPPSPPPAAVWERIVRALPEPRVPARAVRARRWPALGWVAAAAAAAAAIAWLLIDRQDRGSRLATLEDELRQRDRALAVGRDRELASQTRADGCARDLERLQARDALAGEAVALLELAGTQLVPLDVAGAGPTPPGLTANAIYHRGVKRAYVVAHGLPADPAGYRIWVNRAGQRRPAGAMAASPDGAVIASVTADSLDAVPEAFEITRADGQLVLASHIKI